MLLTVQLCFVKMAEVVFRKSTQPAAHAHEDSPEFAVKQVVMLLFLSRPENKLNKLIL